jgi:hypothetical protein
LQTQAPPEQTCPLSQESPVPQRHSPKEEQLSAEPVAQVAHAMPPAPQVPGLGV